MMVQFVSLFEIRTEEKGPRGGRRYRAYVVVAPDGSDAVNRLSPMLAPDERVTSVIENPLQEPLRVRS